MFVRSLHYFLQDVVGGIRTPPGGPQASPPATRLRSGERFPTAVVRTAVCLVIERDSSPLCFVSASGVSLRCVCECINLQLAHFSLESMIMNCVWCH